MTLNLSHIHIIIILALDKAGKSHLQQVSSVGYGIQPGFPLNQFPYSSYPKLPYTQSQFPGFPASQPMPCAINTNCPCNRCPFCPSCFNNCQVCPTCFGCTVIGNFTFPPFLPQTPAPALTTPPPTTTRRTTTTTTPTTTTTTTTTVRPQTLPAILLPVYRPQYICYMLYYT